MFDLAFKNILAYKGRSLTTFILSFISIYFFIVFVSFLNGSHQNMLRNALKVYTGSFQIYEKEYKSEGGYDYLIEDEQKINAILEETKGIKSFASRIETYGLGSSYLHSSAMMLTGVNFQKESELSTLKKALVRGVYESGVNCLYVGEGLAKKLNVGLDDEISFVGSAIDYSFVAELFKVCGIFKTGLYEFDRQTAFLNRDYFDEVFSSKNRASYVVGMVEDLSQNSLIASEISKKLSVELKLYRWEELMKSMVELMQVDSIFGYLSMGLFFLVIFFVILIYGFINISTRIKALGVLKSIGIQERQLDILLFYEIAILSFFAVVCAMPLGAYTAYYFELHPLVIEGISDTFKSYGVVSDRVPTLFEPLTILWNVGVIVGLNFLSVIYPMVYLRSFSPMEAMHHV